ncbi:conjugal transfer protein TrbL [Wolbachia endosymbiont of Litomosoides brasiliensis]|uniref:type IV secretion system protein n=1 Tax=Wolbachia endosymbiont of Litomosoides brasiliensis TaxID=1812117 RepID=UPI00158B9685|nr:type IV secretion system protein [Wolbachia endosymbiont of Litomosoides brasiliensis]NUY39236.1 conjugal transfer protein TrbL [Wolbachia endosymbiont of Litomosoides brasiliensis]
MRKFLLVLAIFLLSSCENRCIKPESLLNLQEKLDVVSTQQKWVDSGVYISDRIKVTEISIVPSKVNFCPQYEDFAIRPEVDNGTIPRTLPFALRAGDSISFSVIGSKMCKDKKDDTIRYIKIDEKCREQETEYFAHVLNQNECQAIWRDGKHQYTICPNKYIVGNLQWLSGKEYWNPNFSKLDQDEEEIKNIINFIKQEENIDCSSFSSNHKGEIDARILNLLCGHTCEFASSNKNKGCVYTEYSSIEAEIFQSINSTSGKSIDVEAISKILKEKQVKTGITLLSIDMDGEKFEPISTGGICTNCDCKIDNDHPVPKLTFRLGDSSGKGGFNIRVTKKHSLKDNLYIRVSDKLPEHNPGGNQGDIPVDIGRTHDIQYMEDLKEKLRGKSGIIYYGIKDHGCGYEKNEGQFNINLTIKEPPMKTFSAIYNFFDEKIKTIFFGSSYKDPNAIHSNTSLAKSLYQSFILSGRAKTIRSTTVSLLVVYIILYTVYYFFGLSHISIYEFLIICVKIGIITQLLRDDSWSFFYNSAFSIFIDTPKHLIEIANFRGTTSNVFEFLDLPLNRFLSLHSVLLIVSLIFSGPLGIVSFCLVIWGLITVSLSIFNALFSFITSMAIVALLLSLAPIFIICLLFAYTRQMFHNWLKYLARFAIHPVVLLISISLISQVMDYIIYSVFDFEICSTCILNINLKIFESCILHGYASKYTPNITAMVAFVILGHAMKALVEASSKISDSLFGVYIMNEPGKQYQQSLMETVGLDEENVQRRKSRSGKGGAPQQLDAPSQNAQIPQRALVPRIPTGGGSGPS